MEDLKKENSEKHINLLAYDNYEFFNSKEEEENYRHSKLNGIKNQSDFIKSEFDRKIRLIEIGSGNCKLPISLYKKGTLKEAYAYEISESRNAFAKKWINDESCENIFLNNKSFLEIKDNEYNDLDLVIGVDLVFQFIDPIEKGFDYVFLRNSFNWLTSGGKIILEVNNLNSLKNTNKWEEFLEPDPWRFSLWNCEYNDESNHLELQKKFIRRDDGFVHETNIILKHYEDYELINMLESCGFINVRLYNDWEKNDYIPESKEYILIAEKP